MQHTTVDAILVTFNRREPLLDSCLSAIDQTIPPRTLVVVDNNEVPAADDVLTALDPATTDIEILHFGDNLGPAGGFTAGFRYLQEHVGDLDWVLLIDDDDPLPSRGIVAQLIESLESTDPDNGGGIGLRGARYSLPLLLLSKPVDASAGGVLPVDCLFGGACPLYRADALEDVGCYRPELFWGNEEHDLGLRLARAGWRLYVAADIYRSLPTPPKERERPGRPRTLVVDPSPSAYYSLRNTIDIGVRYFRPVDVALAIAVRALLKPIANLPVHPILAARTLRQNVRAIVDALRGRLGRTMNLQE